MQVEIDGGIYDELEAIAERRRLKVGHLLNKIISEWCANQKNPICTAAPKGYGIHPSEKKQR